MVKNAIIFESLTFHSLGKIGNRTTSGLLGNGHWYLSSGVWTFIIIRTRGGLPLRAWLAALAFSRSYRSLGLHA